MDSELKSIKDQLVNGVSLEKQKNWIEAIKLYDSAISKYKELSENILLFKLKIRRVKCLIELKHESAIDELKLVVSLGNVVQKSGKLIERLMNFVIKFFSRQREIKKLMLLLDIKIPEKNKLFLKEKIHSLQKSIIFSDQGAKSEDFKVKWIFNNSERTCNFKKHEKLSVLLIKLREDRKEFNMFFLFENHIIPLRTTLVELKILQEGKLVVVIGEDELKLEFE